MAACIDKLDRLSRGAIFDVTCAEDPAHRLTKEDIVRNLRIDNNDVYRLKTSQPISMPGVSSVTSCGRSMPVLKILQTSHCTYNCNYCAFRKDSDSCSRESLEPFELAQITNDMTNTQIIEGLFLSSGIGNNVRTSMTKMVDTVRILREKFLYLGYIHMKILPGVSIDLIEAAGRYADRLSVNMEAPSESALRKIAPNKSIKNTVLKQMQWIETLRRKHVIPRRVGQTTQFVVGGSSDPGENDRALLTVAGYLYDQLDFRRIFYSPFNPVPGTPLENRSPENPKRSHRLYQADFLLSKYNFKPDEFSFDESGRLDLEKDPKESWADNHPEFFPLDIMRAEPDQILRVPGIGPLTAKKILQSRFDGSLRTVDDFKKMVRLQKKALRYVLVNGKKAAESPIIVSVKKAEQIELPFVMSV